MLERRTLDGGIVALVSTALESEGFVAAFTERAGGSSRPPFDSLDLSVATGDDPETVLRNREAVRDALDVLPFALLRQVHGDLCLPVDGDGSAVGFDPRHAEPLPQGDAMVTSHPGVAMAVLTADCVPIALASPDEGRLAVVHAGWRGLAAGVVNAATRAFDRPAGILASVGPAIGPDHYEVGEEVVKRIAAVAGDATQVSPGGGRPRLDLAATAAALLRTLGVAAVEEAGLCTACHPDRFYSHRRDGARTGRQALVAAIRP